MLARLETKIPPVVWALLTMGLEFVISVAIGERFVEDRGSYYAAFIAVCGVVVAGLAVTTFGQAKTTIDPHSINKASQLVTDGVYRFTRNPMYLGLLCMVMAFGLWRGSLLATAVGAATFIGVMNRFQIIPEERFLAKRFGAPYREFRSSVRRWA